MAEPMTLARPYARAAFEWAQSHATFGLWEGMLARLAALSQNPDFQRWVRAPHIAAEHPEAVLARLTQGFLDPAGLRFVQLLARKKRLLLLPWIYEGFMALWHAYTQTVQVRVESPYPITDSIAEDVQRAMERRLGKQVALQMVINPDLVAGIRLQWGDAVLDGSVAGRFERLKMGLMVGGGTTR